MTQAEHFAGTSLANNADMGPRELQKHAVLDGAEEGLMRSSVKQLHLSARAHHRILKLARTIADVAGAERVAAAHVAGPPVLPTAGDGLIPWRPRLTWLWSAAVGRRAGPRRPGVVNQ